MELSQSERQLEMLRLFGDLISETEVSGGDLVLAFGRAAYLAPIPVSIAGATTLLIDNDGDAIKASMRRGELDFVVNSLDEALRVLKNQIRKKQPLGVGLIGDVATTLAEIVERGVKPEFVLRDGQGLAYSPLERNLQRLRAAGVPWRFLDLRDSERPQRSLMGLRRKRYYAWHVKPRTLGDLRSADKLLLSRLNEDDPRRRWLERIPKYVRDSVEGGRWVWLTDEEFDALPDTLPISPEGLP